MDTNEPLPGDPKPPRKPSSRKQKGRPGRMSLPDEVLGRALIEQLRSDPSASWQDVVSWVPEGPLLVQLLVVGLLVDADGSVRLSDRVLREVLRRPRPLECQLGLRSEGEGVVVQLLEEAPE